MGSASHAPSLLLMRRARTLQVVTVLWMAIEAAVSLSAAWAARSPALLGFGGDSAVELLSALVVLWRFRSSAEAAQAEKLAARIAGVLLFLVALFVLLAAVLALRGFREPRPAWLGIAVLLIASFGMPILASQKRKIAAQISSASLKADAAQSSLCAYLSWIALAGLAVNAFFHLSWADPVAALLLLPIIFEEGWSALHSSKLQCDCAN